VGRIKLQTDHINHVKQPVTFDFIIKVKGKLHRVWKIYVQSAGGIPRILNFHKGRREWSASHSVNLAHYGIYIFIYTYSHTRI
jgi:hypothetical protein